MNQSEPQNTVEAKIDQTQIVESAPQIKSEENQANWKAFREQRETERKARIEAEARATQKAAEAEAMRAALEAITNKPSNDRQMNNYTSEDNQETEEDRIDRRVREIIKEREGLYEVERQKQEAAETPMRLKSAYSDFDKVCSAENLDYLEFHYPEVAMPFKYVPEGFDKWTAIYKAVKKFVPNTDSKVDAQRAEKNLSKPGSISAPGNSHGGNAMPSARLDESRKASNWERMQRTLKGLTS